MSLSNAVGPVLWSVDGRGVATVTLNRPEVNNAYNGELIQGLLAALDALGGAPGLRAVVIKGNGKHFQAGADLKRLDADPSRFNPFSSDPAQKLIPFISEEHKPEIQYDQY